MANYIIGTIKIIGQKERIINFLERGIIYEEKDLILEKGKITIDLPGKCLQIGKTRGQRIKSPIVYNFENVLDLEIDVLDLGKYIGKWTIDTKNFLKLAEEYAIDFEIHACESCIDGPNGYCKDEFIVKTKNRHCSLTDPACQVFQHIIKTN